MLLYIAIFLIYDKCNRCYFSDDEDDQRQHVDAAHLPVRAHRLELAHEHHEVNIRRQRVAVNEDVLPGKCGSFLMLKWNTILEHKGRVCSREDLFLAKRYMGA